jgi:hypothetical protein
MRGDPFGNELASVSSCSQEHQFVLARLLSHCVLWKVFGDGKGDDEDQAVAGGGVISTRASLAFTTTTLSGHDPSFGMPEVMPR